MENMKCTKECIKSSFSKNTIRLTIPWGLFMLLLSVLLFINMIKVSFETGIDFIRLLFSVLLAVGFPLLILHVLKIRYYIICDSNLKYYSLFHPFGKTLYFDNYIGKIILTEKGSQGSYSVIYLVDKKSKTAFKIVGLHYKKFGEIINAIPLRKMDYSFRRMTRIRNMWKGRLMSGAMLNFKISSIDACRPELRIFEKNSAKSLAVRLLRPSPFTAISSNVCCRNFAISNFTFNFAFNLASSSLAV